MAHKNPPSSLQTERLKRTLEGLATHPLFQPMLVGANLDDPWSVLDGVRCQTPQDVTETSLPYSELLTAKAQGLGPVIRSGGSTGRRKTIAHSWDFTERVTQLGSAAVLSAVGGPVKSIMNCFSAAELLGAYFFTEGVARQLQAKYFPVGSQLPLAEVATLMREFNIETIAATPTYFSQLLGHLHPSTHSIEILLYLGEGFPGDLYQQYKEKWPSLRILSLSYTTTETGPIGYQCPRQEGSKKHHLHQDYVVVEVIDPDTQKRQPKGTQGEVAVTTLLNTGSPTLRYLPGDMGRIDQEACACGDPAPVLELMGRSASSIKFCGTLFFKEYIVNLVSSGAMLGETDLQVIYSDSKDNLFLEILIDEAKLTPEQLEKIRGVFENDYKIGHVRSFPGLRSCSLRAEKRVHFKTTVSGKTAFFHRV